MLHPGIIPVQACNPDRLQAFRSPRSAVLNEVLNEVLSAMLRLPHGCLRCGCHGYGHGALQPAPKGGGSRQPQACDATTSTSLHSWLFEFCSDDPTSNHIGCQPVRANLDPFGSSCCVVVWLFSACGIDLFEAPCFAILLIQ